MMEQQQVVSVAPRSRADDDDRLFTGLLFLTLGVVACLMPAQNDTWWLLRAGEEMWWSRQVMLHDEFTHTVAGAFWLNHEWGTELLFYALYRVGGLPLLTAFCAAAVIFAWWVVYKLIPGPAGARLILIGTGAALTTAGWSLRAQTMTLAMFAATLWILVRREYLWVLPPLFLLWANLHGAVATGGLLIVAAVAAALVVDRDSLVRLTVTGVLCGVAMTLTPLGWSFWLEIPRSMGRARAIGISEWRAPSLTNLADLPLWVGVVALLAVLVSRREKLKSYEALMLSIASAFTFLLAVRGARNIALFVLCAIPTAAILLARGDAPRPASLSSLQRRMLFACTVLGVGFVGYAWSKPLDRLGWNPLPDEMRSAIEQCQGPLYNRYDEGGYLIWFVKDRRVFMDSRQDPFPEQMVIDQRRLEATGDYRQTFDRYQIQCALVVSGSPLSQRLKYDGWREQPAGPGWMVYSVSGDPNKQSENTIVHGAGKQPKPPDGEV